MINKPVLRYLLSEREIQVVRLLALDFTHKQIAEELGISVKTVEKHVGKANWKTNTHSAVMLTHYAFHAGLVENVFA